MLVLSRKSGQTVVIDHNVTITVQRISGNRVRLAIDAPRNVRIVRGELDPFGAEKDADDECFQPECGTVAV